MTSALTNDQAEKVSRALEDLDCIFISLKNIAPNLEKDLDPEGGIKEGVAWDEVVGALCERGRGLVINTFAVLIESEESSAA